MNYKLETGCLILTGVLLDVFGSQSRNHRLSGLGYNKLGLNVTEEPRSAWKGILMLDDPGKISLGVAKRGFLHHCCCAVLQLSALPATVSSGRSSEHRAGDS